MFKYISTLSSHFESGGEPLTSDDMAQLLGINKRHAITMISRLKLGSGTRWLADVRRDPKTRLHSVTAQPACKQMRSDHLRLVLKSKPDATTQELVSKIGCDRSQVYRVRKELGIPNPPSTHEQIRRALRNSPALTNGELYHRFGQSDSITNAVSQARRELGVPLLPPRKMKRTPGGAKSRPSRQWRDEAPLMRQAALSRLLWPTRKEAQ